MDAHDLTHDAFLGGQLHLWQPRRGYRAGVDPVLLAAAVPAKSGQSVLELGCGAGAASLCLAARVPRLVLNGVELQNSYTELARRNAAENGLPLQVFLADLRTLPAALRQMQFDHVIMNPPYLDRSKGSASADIGRNVAFGGDTALSDWIDIGIKRLSPKGHLTLIQRIDRLPDVLNAIGQRLGSVVMRPIIGREGHVPDRFILRAIHSGRAAFRISTPLVMHQGATHIGDTETYSAQVRTILRDGASLSITA